MRNASSQLEPRPLSSAVSISRQFLRSIRIDADFGREDALSGYVCQGTARAVLEAMARQLIGTKQRAFTWTGPYGGGKSSLALMLCSLVGGSQKLRARAKQILDLPQDSAVNEAFEARGEGWLVLPIVGRRASVVQDIWAALVQAQKTTSKEKSGRALIQHLVEIVSYEKQGVLLVIDELGKFLEASALGSGDDIYFFQELAEAASRCNGKLVVVGILHQAFDAYASRLGRDARDDWGKVQGRFVDIPLVAATDEVIELIGRAITVSTQIDKGQISLCVAAVSKAMRARKPSTPPSIENSLKNCWPLHPVTAVLLGPISRRRFGQNERSTFGFLASREPFGFVEFLESSRASPLSMYEPARYWDYLRANLEPAILASPDSHRWAIGADAVERAEAKGDAIHIDLTKTVALIEMFRSGSGIVAEPMVLSVAVHGDSAAQVMQALKDLVQWKILIERRHLGGYGVFAGSDFDVESAVSQARGEIGTPSLEHVSALTNLQPILAKRLYAQTGTMHWFNRRILRLSELPPFTRSFSPDTGSVGTFVLCLYEADVTSQVADVLVRQLSKELLGMPLLIGIPANAVRIDDLSLELQAAERALKTRPELEGDAVARRELMGRISALRGALEDELADAFVLCKWYWQGERKHAQNMSLSAIASEIASEIYAEAPHIFSELLNREEPSSNSNRARRNLMCKMVEDGDKENLAFDGYPSEAGLYYTILQAPGLHRSSKDGGWRFCAPGNGARGAAMRPLWRATHNLVITTTQQLRVTDIYRFWGSAPFGLRAGVMPVLALAFYLAHRSELALYVEGVFTPELSTAVVDDWLQDPHRIGLQYVSASKDRDELVQAIASTVVGRAGAAVSTAPLDAARSLVAMVLGLPAWTRRTATVSENAQQIRSMLSKASDPHKVLFADLPTLLNAQSGEELIVRLRAVTTELTSAYGKMLNEVRVHLLGALDHVNRPLSELKARAINVKGLSGEFKLDAFASRLEVYDGSDSAVEGLLSLATGKPSGSFVDRDIDAGVLQLATWALEFRRVESMAPLRGRPSTRRVLSVVFGAAAGHDASGSVDVAETDMPAIDQLARQLLGAVKREKRSIALAAFAEAGAVLVQSGEES